MSGARGRGVTGGLHRPGEPRVSTGQRRASLAEIAVDSLLLRLKIGAIRPGSYISSWKPITCGTPQGTLVGPVAFLAMVNGAAAQAQNRFKYVDNLTVYEARSVDDIQTESRLQQMTDQLCEWADENKMVLNTDKCQIMHFFTAKKPIVLPDVTIENTIRYMA